jgi:hypothetical protein
VPGAETALASLADLLDPVTDTAVRALPAPLGNALLAAVGQVSPQAPVTDVLLERAIVRLLRGLAEADGLLLAIDDEQWLDEDSRRLLATAAVRLAGAPVRWLVAVRSARADNSADNGADDGLARVLAHELGPGAVRVDLAGLSDDALADLVRSRFPGEWSVGVLRQVVALAAGNPYAGLEIARETVARGERAGTLARVPPTLDTAVDRRPGRRADQGPAARGRQRPRRRRPSNWQPSNRRSHRQPPRRPQPGRRARQRRPGRGRPGERAAWPGAPVRPPAAAGGGRVHADGLAAPRTAPADRRRPR